MKASKQIVIDYRKCVSVINSCLTISHLESCEKLINNFYRKHTNEEGSFKRWKELYKYITSKIKLLNN